MYTLNAPIAPVIVISGNTGVEPHTPDTYKSAVEVGTSFTFISPKDIYPQLNLDIGNITVLLGGEPIYSGSENDSFTTVIESGTYIVQYDIEFEVPPQGSLNKSIQYEINGVKNRYPLKKWTITDVVQRTLDLIEPHLDGYPNRFTFNEEQAEEYKNVIAPEFAFTKENLRERLQQIGGFIHAEPRLRNGVIYFDKYGMNDYADMYVHGELKAARTNSLTEISMSYEEYEREYLGLGKKALEKTDLSKHERKVVWRTNKILPVKLESWMITRSRKVSFHRIAVDSSAQEKKSTDSKLHFAISLITTLAASFAVVDVASAFSMQVLILALVRLIPFIINIPLGLIRGYGLYATREVSNFESLCTLIDSANVYFEGKEEKVFMSDETDR